MIDLTPTKNDEPCSKQPDKIKDHEPPSMPISRGRSTTTTSVGAAKKPTVSSENGMNPHPPSDDDKSYQQFFSFLNNSLEIHPLDYKILEEMTHFSRQAA